jgi:hypothetical protein
MRRRSAGHPSVDDRGQHAGDQHETGSRAERRHRGGIRFDRA